MRAAGYLAIVGGFLLFIAGATGWGIFAFLWNILKDHLGIAGAYAGQVRKLFQILIFLANLGGITVMLGGWVILKGFQRTGRVLVMIGCGTGLLTLVWQLLVAWANNSVDAWTGSMMTFTGIGTVLALISQRLAK
jgi:hypothetical protein